MTINFSELSTQEIREIVTSGQRSLYERTDSAIKQKTQAIITLIDEIYELVAAEDGDPDIEILNCCGSTLLDIKDAFALLNFDDFQREE